VRVRDVPQAFVWLLLLSPAKSRPINFPGERALCIFYVPSERPTDEKRRDWTVGRRGKGFKYPFTNILVMDTAIEEQILDRLGRIEKELGEIRKHMVDVDTLLSEDEKKLLEESVKREARGELSSLEDLENARTKA